MPDFLSHSSRIAYFAGGRQITPHHSLPALPAPGLTRTGGVPVGALLLRAAERAPRAGAQRGGPRRHGPACAHQRQQQGPHCRGVPALIFPACAKLFLYHWQILHKDIRLSLSDTAERMLETSNLKVYTSLRKMCNRHRTAYIIDLLSQPRREGDQADLYI